MILLNLFSSKKYYTANIAKKRLQIIIQEQRSGAQELDFLLNLKNDLLLVLQKYIKIKPHIVSFKIEKTRKKKIILELSIPEAL